LLLDDCVQLACRVKWRVGVSLGDQLNRPEQAAPSYIGNVGMAFKALAQQLIQICAQLRATLHQPVTLNDVLHRQRGCAGYRVADIGMAMLERTRAVYDGVDQLVAAKHRGNGLITTTQPFGQRQDIRRNALLLERMVSAGTANAAHDFVEDQDHTIAVADLAYLLEVARYRGDGPRRGAHYGFRHKGADGFRA